MPIYAYRCEACGFEKDVLQKLSDAPLTQCPECHAETFRKQLTAAGFQLKGSGWYVTDFRGGSNNSKGSSDAKGSNDAAPAKSGATESTAAGGGSGSDSSASASSASSSPAAPTATDA